MFSKFDEQYLNNPDYNMALEKFFKPEYYEKLDDSCNGTIETAYPFSNERLKDYFKQLNLKDKSVLTVGSSGDQALNSIYYGAKSVTVVDANLYTKYFVSYKISAIKNLPFNVFEKYFLNLESPFNIYVFQKIFHDLDKDSQCFWGTIFLNCSEECTDTMSIYEKILDKDDVWIEYIASEFYENPNAYAKLQKILREAPPNLQFINAEFYAFPAVTQEKFDFIFLSNIFKYVASTTLKQTVNQLYDNNLNPDGKIQLHYNFRWNDPIAPEFWSLLFPNRTITTHKLGNSDTTYFITKPKTATAQKQAERQL